MTGHQSEILWNLQDFFYLSENFLKGKKIDMLTAEYYTVFEFFFYLAV